MLPMKILTAQQMNEVDRLTTEEFGLPSLVLMENAGLNLYWYLDECFEDLSSQNFAILCGIGNNGGDGFALARQLLQRDIQPHVYLLSKIEKVSGDARLNLEAYRKSGGIILEVSESSQWSQIGEKFTGYDIIVDAILGTGISKPLSGLYLDVVSTVNTADAFVLSVDLPSGMFSDSLTGGVPTIQASATVSFTAPKIAHILNEDQEAIGDLKVVPIGSPIQLLARSEFDLNLLTHEQVISWLPHRQISSHKGHLGHVLVAAGSLGKSGAAVLCGDAALRTGSGLVTVCTPDVVQPVVSSYQAELMTEGVHSTPQGTFALRSVDPVLQLLEGKNAAALGPGLGQESETVDFVHQIVQKINVPLVLDADALNSFQNCIEKLTNNHKQPLIVTPHPGEFSRLTGQPVEKILSHKVDLAREFARETGVWVVLKSFRTLVAEPNGPVFACPLGNPGMATAGMGDVLTGVITALLGMAAARKTTSPTDISRAVLSGVYLHSLAGEIAAAEVGPEALKAGDVTASLGLAYQDLSDKSLSTRVHR